MSQTELLDQFILEARECLEMIGQRLLDVEREPDNRELLNDLFRSVHTLKGNCGLFEFKALERVVHAGEDLLDRVRNGTLTYNDHIADALLEAMDYTSELVDLIAAEGGLPAAVDDRSQQLAADLRRHLNPESADTAVASQTPVAAAVDPSAAAQAAAGIAPGTMPPNDGNQTEAQTEASTLPGWVSRLGSEVVGGGGVALRYRPEAECFFKGEDPWHHAKLTPGLQSLDVGPLVEWPTADALDCYACNLDIVLFSDAPRAYVEEHFR